ncbi:MAG TPA: NAD(P)/FAD-dependent oxidoreductase [Pseudonocardiaceae bacterium]|nr:NAD(P)/FAD-dependent oxidoreductase [Pseudonocardiaceae bacterium]
MAETCDVVVIGMGPGGEDLAGRLAAAGLDVIGVDCRLVGGECPYYGCIPSKMIIRAANVLAEARRVGRFSGQASVRPDFAPVAARIRAEATDNWDDAVAVERFVGKGGRFLRGRGRLAGPRSVVVTLDSGEEVQVQARRGVVLNTGTDPLVPDIPGLADTPLWTNREILAIEKAPESLAVLGGGAIGSELAQAFARFGTRVSVLGSAPRLLPYEEPESSEYVAAAFADDGIDVRVGVQVTSVSYDGRFTLEVDGFSVDAEHLLVATGRASTVRSLGVDTIGLDPAAKSVPVDDFMRVVDGVWAIGDITGHGAFTHMSMYQAAIAYRSITGEDGSGAEYHAVPRVTFTDPEVGSVGMSEAQARAAGLNVRVGKAGVPASTRGWIHGEPHGDFVKVIEDADRGVLVGATAVGANGGEVLSALVVAVHGRVPVSTLRGMIYAYPTFHRGIEVALADLH